MRRRTDVTRPARLLAAALSVVGVFTLGALTPVAFARTSHSYESVIPGVPSVGPGGPVTMPGPLEEVNSMAVFSGDLYVAERLEGNGIAGSDSRTDQFASSVSKPGEYDLVSQLPLQPEPGQRRDLGIAFGTGAGETEMYIGQEDGPPAGPTGVNVFAAGLCGDLECASLQKFWTGAGAPSPFVDVLSVAVDHHLGDWASGDVFVADTAGRIIDIFEPVAGGNEKYVGQVTGLSPSEPFKGISSIAMSGLNGDLVVGVSLGGSNSAAYVFRPEEEGPKKGKYVLVQELLPPNGPLKNVTAVAVDDGNGEIYVATTTAIYEFGPDGVFRGEMTGVPKEGIPTGIKGQTEEVHFNYNTPRPVSLAVDPVSHRVFVGVYGSQVGPKGENLATVDVLSPDIVVPDVVTEAPANLKLETDPETGAESWGVRPTGTVNPDSAGEASCWFAWGTSPSLGHEAPCSSTVHEGASPVHVHASLTGLAPDTTYYYRLQARNANGPNLGEESQTYRFTTPGPGLESESVSAVSSSSATLEATVAPHDAPVEEHDLQVLAKAPTTYYFQYSTQSTERCAEDPSSCASVPLAPASIGAGLAPVAVEQSLSGLAPSTTYHYRLVAVNEALPASASGVLSAFYGPDRAFTTQAPGKPSVLPDGRAWELVSPVDKHGARIEGGAQAAVDGEKFTFITGTPTTSSLNGYDGNGNQVLTARIVPGRWSSADISLSHSSPVGILAGVKPEYRFFSDDLSLAFAESLGPFSVPKGWRKNQHGEWEEVVEVSPVPTERTPYLRHNTTCGTEWFTCYEPLLNTEDTAGGQSHESMKTNESKANFVDATPDGNHAIIRSHVQLTGASVAGSGGPWLYGWSADDPAADRLTLISTLPAQVEGLSADGSLAFYANPGPVQTELYVADVPTGESVQLDLTEGGSPGKAELRFGGASRNGSKAFFTDAAQLRKDAGVKGADLYVCEVQDSPLGCTLRDLTPVPKTGQPGAHENGQVSQVLGISRDGSYVYFVAKGVQVAGATAGEENVYVAHEHEGTWTTMFIASSSSQISATSTVSPNGRWLAFSTNASLTGYDNRDVKTGLQDGEVYLYDALSEKLACVSCDSTGARPIGSSYVPPPTRPFGPVEFTVPAGAGATRSLFDNGRLFFDSGDALVSQDTNDNVDVYEFEPSTMGDCSSERPTFDVATGGCVSLISSGVAYGPSVFLEASGTGGDVFFTTAERLVPEDVDTAVDVYDAHECTSASPCAPPEAAAPEECSSAASCRAAPGAQPSVYGAPSSATFSGAGNVLSLPASSKTTVKGLSNAQKLARALEQCRKKNRKHKQRVGCERQARARYGRVRSSRSSVRRSAVRPGKAG